MKPDLSLVIEEPIAGHFYWLIVRPGGWLRLGPCQVIESAQGPLPSYKAAQEAGQQVLANLQPARERAAPSGFGGAWDVRTVPGAL
ncbi:hypothetical protein [Variovorax jilinensis]|uniref:hypothetical protein n=1 Tax=Variovorax jilinensis TaxID=3053513 RepID=UPI00257681B5|nr:hypothetical protein [Variovorax sp. J22P168]